MTEENEIAPAMTPEGWEQWRFLQAIAVTPELFLDVDNASRIAKSNDLLIFSDARRITRRMTADIRKTAQLASMLLDQSPAESSEQELERAAVEEMIGNVLRDADALEAYLPPT